MEQKILVEVSARHLHLSKEHLEALFGAGHQLTVKKMLSQPGHFASEERVEVIGPKGRLTMTVLGPVRKETQVEVSLTDARALGIDAPIRESGDLENTPGCTLEGLKGRVVLEKGVIAAKRHIHITPEDAMRLGVTEREEVALEVSTEKRAVVLKNVVVRVSDQYTTAAHIDTDEANAVAASGEVKGVVIK